MSDNEVEKNDKIIVSDDLVETKEERKEERKEEGKEGRESGGNERGVIALKVKADEPDISPEDRKKNVKKLAGAISHALRNNGEVSVRCFGAASIFKAAKALAIARDYVKVQGLQLECSPGFINAKMNDNDISGICFYTFASKISDQQVDVSKVETVLKVSSDPKEMDIEEKRDRLKKLAGAIAHTLTEKKETVIRCFGAASISKGVKGISISRGKVAQNGGDLYCYPFFIVSDINGSERTGIAWYCYSNS